MEVPCQAVFADYLIGLETLYPVPRILFRAPVATNCDYMRRNNHLHSEIRRLVGNRVRICVAWTCLHFVQQQFW